jgi:hypothetical protein
MLGRVLGRSRDRRAGLIAVTGGPTRQRRQPTGLLYQAVLENSAQFVAQPTVGDDGVPLLRCRESDTFRAPCRAHGPVGPRVEQASRADHYKAKLDQRRFVP